MVDNSKCSGKRCPMQWNGIKPDQCKLYEKCEYYTPDMLSDNEKLKWLALMLMIFCGDEPADININPSDVVKALRCCSEDDGCDNCPYDKTSDRHNQIKCYNKLRLDAANLIGFVNIAQKTKEFKKENCNDS